MRACVRACACEESLSGGGGGEGGATVIEHAKAPEREREGERERGERNRERGGGGTETEEGDRVIGQIEYDKKIYSNLVRNLVTTNAIRGPPARGAIEFLGPQSGQIGRSEDGGAPIKK